MKFERIILGLSLGALLAFPLNATANPIKQTTKKTTTTQSTAKKSECNKRLSDWDLQQNGIDAHELKYDVLGKKAKVSLYELCACPDKKVVIRLKQCKGDEIFTGVKLK